VPSATEVLRTYVTSRWCVARILPDACFGSRDRFVLEVRKPEREPILVLAVVWEQNWLGAVGGPVVNLAEQTQGQNVCRGDIIVD
jgi:hypothetical protein